MTSLQSKIEPLASALAEVVANTYHYDRSTTDLPYLIWQEDGGVELQTEDGVTDQMVTGVADYYTQDEFDGNVDAIQLALNGTCAWWALNSVQYEEETNLIHYSWDWRCS